MKKEKNKKGALELSVNTIIIIVIGVTLLVLGLQFVRKSIGQSIDLSDKAFQDANKQLDALGSDLSEFVTIAPETVRLNAGEIRGFVVLIKNVEQKTYSGITANVKTSDDGISHKVKCEFLDGKATKNIRSPLSTGANERLNIRVKTEKSSIGAYGCEFSLSGSGIEESTYSTRRDIEVIVES